MGFDLYTRISSQSKKIGPSRIIRITMDVYVYFGRVQITPSVILAIMRSVAQGSYGSSKYLKVHKKMSKIKYLITHKIDENQKKVNKNP